MNPLYFFKKIERDSTKQMDPSEGLLGFISQKERDKLFPMLSGYKDSKLKVGFINDSLDMFNIYCMYALYHDDTKHTIQSISDELINGNIFGDYCVYIYNTDEFIKRIVNTIKIKCEEREILLAILGNVRYNSSFKNIGTLSIFDKELSFENQCEWRLAI